MRAEKEARDRQPGVLEAFSIHCDPSLAQTAHTHVFSTCGFLHKDTSPVSTCPLSLANPLTLG